MTTVFFLGVEQKAALQALAKHVNATGGIDGHQLSFAISDNQSTASTSVSLASPLLGQSRCCSSQRDQHGRPVDDLLSSSSGPVIYDLSPGDHPKLGMVPDGRPFDLDYGDGYPGRAIEYANLDTQAAVEEALAQGIEPFVLTVDAAGNEYLGEVFERGGGYEVGAILFLISGLSAYVTGTDLLVDGGAAILR